MDIERDRLRRMASDACWRLAFQHEDARRTADALASARRAVELDPDDEQGVARLIALLDLHGDRSGALTVYAALERRLAEGFSAQPAPETRALMKALRQRPTPVYTPPPAQPVVQTVEPVTPISVAAVAPRFAKEVGAGWIVRGSVTGTADHLALAAWIIDLTDGHTEAEATIEGPADSLAFLVDRLSAKLLGLAAGVEGHRLMSFEGATDLRPAVSRPRSCVGLEEFASLGCILGHGPISSCCQSRTGGPSPCVCSHYRFLPLPCRSASRSPPARAPTICPG